MGRRYDHVSVFNICSDHLVGAEELAKHDGMVSAPIDLSYMGVYTIWTNDLGMKSLNCTPKHG